MTVWIYFLRAQTINRIKIGQTRNLQKRLRDLANMNGDDTELLGVISDQCATESQLHQMFARDRAQGEWFYPSNELLTFIKKNAVSDHPAVLEQHLMPYNIRRAAARAAEQARPYPGFPTLPKTFVSRVGDGFKALPYDAKYIQSLERWELKNFRVVYGDTQVDDRIKRGSVVSEHQ
jgi:hypothetical protein